MLALIAASLSFAAIHLLVSGTRLRDALVSRIGERAYAGAFSLVSGVLLGLMIWAYIRAHVPQVTPWYELRWIAVAAMLIAFLLIVLGVTTPGVTGVGGGKKLAEPDSARGIQRITRHPFLWGVTLWALVHLIYNPGAVNGVFFGTFFVVALAGTFSIDRKRERRFGELWPRYAQLTSNLPFAAIAQGRNRFSAGEIGLWRIAAAIAVFVTVLILHGKLFGMPAW